MEAQMLTKEKKLDEKVFIEEEIVGEKMNVSQVLGEIRKDKIFFSSSNGGVTFSGGEPLMQTDFLKQLLILCNQEGIHTAIDTSGHVDTKALKKIIDYTDLFLFDLKLCDDFEHVKYTGASNQMSLKNLEILAKKKKEIVIRFPLIPGITDGNKNLSGIAGFMQNLQLTRIDILPYHMIAKNKYSRLGRQFRMHDAHAPTESEIQRVEKYFKKQGFTIEVGG